MSNDIKHILERLAIVEGKTVPFSPKGSMTSQQERVPQLPALFKPKDISPTLTKKPYQKHPMDGYMVGETALNPRDPDEDLAAKHKALQDLERDPGHDKEAVRQRKLDLDKEARQRGLAEAMQEVEEDMLSKVKNDLKSYLDQLDNRLSGSDDGRREKQTTELDKLSAKEKKDRDLIQKAVDAVERGQVEEDDFSITDAEVTTDPVQLEAEHVVTMENGTVLEIHGNDHSGYEIRHGNRSLPTRFPNINHAKMAVDIFKSRKKMQQPEQQDLSQDYIEEK